MNTNHHYDPHTRANIALYDGNRSDILTHIEGLPEDGRTLWLRAAAADSIEAYHALLQRVYATGEAPYAALAKGILEREARMDALLKQQPRWYSLIARNGRRIVLGIFCLILTLIVIWLGRKFINAPDASPAPNTSATAPLVENSAASAASESEPPALVLTPLPTDRRPSANYQPLGILQILNAVFPENRQVVLDTGGVDPADGTVFLALHLEFTCGTGQSFCAAPPQANLALLLADNTQINDAGYRLQDDTPSVQVERGQSWRGWIVFPVPVNQAPAFLLVAVNVDNDETVDQTFRLDIP